MVNKPILQGTHNTRELGGYPLKDGGQTKRDRFLRSDSLCGLTLEDRQIVLDGLKPEDRVIIQGLQKVSNGQKVQVGEIQNGSETVTVEDK